MLIETMIDLDPMPNFDVELTIVADYEPPQPPQRNEYGLPTEGGTYEELEIDFVILNDHKYDDLHILHLQFPDYEFDTFLEILEDAVKVQYCINKEAASM